MNEQIRKGLKLLKAYEEAKAIAEDFSIEDGRMGGMLRDRAAGNAQAAFLNWCEGYALAALSHPAPDVPGAGEVFTVDIDGMLAELDEAREIMAEFKAELAKLAESDPEISDADRRRLVHQGTAARYREMAMRGLQVHTTDALNYKALKADLDAAREELREAEAKLAKRLEADMFWDYYDPERPYYSVEELIQEREYEGEGIVQVQEAIRCPDAAYIYRIVDDPETDNREIVLERLSDEDHVHFRAAMSVASGAREMWGVMVDRLAAQMFAENPAPVPERMHTRQWKNLDWHYRKHHRSLAHERLAAALKGSGHD